MKGLFIPEITVEMIRNACLEGIEALMAEGEMYDIDYNTWIPCSERLPEKDGDYLVTLENGFVKILGYSTEQRTTYPKGFYYVENGFSWRQTMNPVVAWMSLPESWKGTDDE